MEVIDDDDAASLEDGGCLGKRAERRPVRVMVNVALAGSA